MSGCAKGLRRPQNASNESIFPRMSAGGATSDVKKLQAKKGAQACAEPLHPSDQTDWIRDYAFGAECAWSEERTGNPPPPPIRRPNLAEFAELVCRIVRYLRHS